MTEDLLLHIELVFRSFGQNANKSILKLQEIIPYLQEIAKIAQRGPAYVLYPVSPLSYNTSSQSELAIDLGAVCVCTSVKFYPCADSGSHHGVGGTQPSVTAEPGPVSWRWHFTSAGEV